MPHAFLQYLLMSFPTSFCLSVPHSFIPYILLSFFFPTLYLCFVSFSLVPTCFLSELSLFASSFPSLPLLRPHVPPSLLYVPTPFFPSLKSLSFSTSPFPSLPTCPLCYLLVSLPASFYGLTLWFLRYFYLSLSSSPPFLH